MLQCHVSITNTCLLVISGVKYHFSSTDLENEHPWVILIALQKDKDFHSFLWKQAWLYTYVELLPKSCSKAACAYCFLGCSVCRPCSPSPCLCLEQAAWVQSVEGSPALNPVLDLKMILSFDFFLNAHIGGFVSRDSFGICVERFCRNIIMLSHITNASWTISSILISKSLLIGTFDSMCLPLPLDHITPPVLLPSQLNSRWLIFVCVCVFMCSYIWALWIDFECFGWTGLCRCKHRFAYPDDNICLSIPWCQCLQKSNVLSGPWTESSLLLSFSPSNSASWSLEHIYHICDFCICTCFFFFVLIF